MVVNFLFVVVVQQLVVNVFVVIVGVLALVMDNGELAYCANPPPPTRFANKCKGKLSVCNKTLPERIRF